MNGKRTSEGVVLLSTEIIDNILPNLEPPTIPIKKKT
jgi:hypothetical protein